MSGNLVNCSVLVFLLLTGLPVFAVESELFWGSRGPIWNNDGDTIFMRDSENQLIIEDDSPAFFGIREDEAIAILKKKYSQTVFSEKSTFDKIHIFSNCTLIYDIFGECLKVNLQKKELPNL